MARASRTDPDAYDRYLRGMDASLKQKVALTAAHLLGEGTLADMGMGSGSTSDALAALYPALQVVGVDLDPEMVARAARTHQRANLSFVPGDVGGQVFSPGGVDAILNSSVLHHVTSFGGYRDANAWDALAVQAEQLAVGGLLVVRDFVSPGDEPVVLSLPEDDAETLALFEDFRKRFRSLHPQPGAAAVELAPTPGWRRFEMTHQLAAEFVLRKDYRTDWDAELQEAYTFGTVHDFAGCFDRLGLRLLHCVPLRNPWIVANRFEGKFALHDLAGEVLDWPATNLVAVGLKIAPGETVAVRQGPEQPPIGYLETSSWRRDDGVVFDLVRRPSRTLDLIPWFEDDRGLQVLTRRSYPRPIVGTHRSPVSGGAPAIWLTEPIAVVQRDLPLGLTVERRLLSDAGLSGSDLLRIHEGSAMLPSPGGLLESVVPVFVQIRPDVGGLPEPHGSGFSTSGDTRSIEARQLLRSAAVGGLLDARVEVHVTDLLLSLGRPLGAWIGAAVEVPQGEAVDGTPLAMLLDAEPRRRWERVEAPTAFLTRRCARFDELVGAEVRAGGGQVLEWVEPTSTSLDTVVLVVLRADDAGIWVALEDDDRPAAQAVFGRSNLVSVPAYRLGRQVSGRRAAREAVRRLAQTELGLVVGRMLDLGGAYYPSSGVTPELAHPLVAVLSEERAAKRAASWVRLDELVVQRRRLIDGHTRVAVLRAARAVGLLK